MQDGRFSYSFRMLLAVACVYDSNNSVPHIVLPKWQRLLWLSQLCWLYGNVAKRLLHYVTMQLQGDDTRVMCGCSG
jgi:hypothetical protein